VREFVPAAKRASHPWRPSSLIGATKARETAATNLAHFVLFGWQPMSVSKDPRPTVTDSTPDRTAADSADKAVSRPDPKAPSPVEPHWESVIAAATD
jgi:hypothetical protein